MTTPVRLLSDSAVFEQSMTTLRNEFNTKISALDDTVVQVFTSRFFTQMTGVNIPAEITSLQTAGYSKAGIGSGRYIYDQYFDATHYPREAFVSADGRVFRLAEPFPCLDHFGALGNGTLVAGVVQGTVDDGAFAAVSAKFLREGGGYICGRAGAVYVVGAQQALGSSPDWSYAPATLVEQIGVTGRWVLEGNGATVIQAAGGKYGTFDRASGLANTSNAGSDRATPYQAVFRFSNCTGPISIRNWIFDGQNTSLALGGTYGDLGYQIPHTGVQILLHNGVVTWNNLEANNQAQDGFYLNIIADNKSGASGHHLSSIRGDKNGRQGLSLTGGRGGTVTGYSFTRTGKGNIASPPAAGIDLESEYGQSIRNWVFENGVCADNTGAGWLSSVGDCAYTVLRDSQIIGTTSYSIYDSRPHTRFENCLIVGSAITADPTQLYQDCTFTYNNSYSPTGLAYLDGFGFLFRPLGGVKLVRCSFDGTGGASTITSGPVVTYQDCTFTQGNQSIVNIAGQFNGNNNWTGTAPNYSDSGTRINGNLVINGSNQQISSSITTYAFDLEPGAYGQSNDLIVPFGFMSDIASLVVNKIYQPIVMQTVQIDSKVYRISYFNPTSTKQTMTPGVTVTVRTKHSQ